MTARIHPTAIVEDNVTLGDGTSVWDHAHLRHGACLGEQCIVGGKAYVAYDVQIGNRVKINSLAYICNGVTIEDGVMISAAVTFTNDRFPRAASNDLRRLRPSDPDEHTRPTLVREGATIGAGAIVGNDLAIGRFAMVGMGAVVTRSVPDFHLVLGNPARSIGCVCRCGKPLVKWVELASGESRRVACSECGAAFDIRDQRAQEILGWGKLDMATEPSRYGIVGGGLLGLTLALRLAQRGHRVTLLEGADRLGGLADAWQLGDVTWDRHYHVTLLSDAHLRALLAELGLDDQMRWVQTRTGFLVDGQLASLSNSWEFLRFPPLNPLDKARLGWTIWHASRLRDWRPLEQILVGDWLTRHSGKKTFERIWLPLLKAKLGAAWRRTSAAFIWATIQRMYAARRTGLKREMFGYLPGGYARTLAALAQRLNDLGVTVRLNCRARSIEQSAAGQFRVTRDDVMRMDEDGATLTFDRVIVTAAPPLAAKMCPQLTAEEAERLTNVEYLGILCASVLLRKPLSEYYVTNITDPAPFTGVIEMTALVDPAELGGRSLVYLPRYATGDDGIWSSTDEQIRAEFLAAIARLYPGFSTEDVLAFRVSRVRHVFALPTLDYSRRVPGTETSLPGLFLVNSAQITNGTLNVNETVRLAESSLETVSRPLPGLLAATGASTNVASRNRSASAARPLASLSLDLDNKWSYLKTRGDRRWEDLPSYLDLVVPRFLGVLEALQLRLTVFVVGQDAALEQNRAALAAIGAAGHEIGNHSFHHEPWLHRYSHDELETELTAAEDAIEDATGVRPTGFRGPGFSLSPALLASLARRGYHYDASTFPTFLGPLARAYYFLSAGLNRAERAKRSQLFGHWKEGFRPLRPYWWQWLAASDDPAGAGRRLLEIPVTTMPVLRAPIHVSYLLYLCKFSRRAAWAYWRLAMALCRLRRVAPSLLLHPLDFLGGDDEPDLAFFPAMDMAGADKLAFVRAVLADFARRYEVTPLGEHAAAISQDDKLPAICAGPAPRQASSPLAALH